MSETFNRILNVFGVRTDCPLGTKTPLSATDIVGNDGSGRLTVECVEVSLERHAKHPAVVAWQKQRDERQRLIETHNKAAQRAVPKAKRQVGGQRRHG